MTDLELLLAKDRVREAVIRLFNTTDERDWDAVRACFADTVDFDMTSLAGGTPQQLPADAIVAAWREGLAPLRALHHQVGNLLTVVDGDRATVTCHGIACHYLPNPAGNTRTFVGTYVSGLVRQEGVWRIDAFRFDLRFVDGNLDLEDGATAG